MDITTFAVNQFIPHPMMLFAAGHLQRDRVASPCSRQLGELLLGRWARGRAVHGWRQGGKTEPRA